MHSAQYLFIRSVFSFSFFFLLMNYKFPHYMITGIERHQFKHVVAKSLLGIIYISCLYTAIKYLPLVVASLIQNLSPLFTAIFSYIFLKKGLTKLRAAVLVVSFIGVVVMLTGKLELTFQLFDPDPDLM